MNKKGNNNIEITLAIFAILAVIGIFVAALGFDKVDPSHRGVKVRLGELQGIMEPGLQWTGLFTTVHQYDLRLRKVEITMDKANSAVDKEGQDIFGSIQANFRIRADKIQDIYKNVGVDSAKLHERVLVHNVITEGFKSVTSEYTSLEIFQKRQEIKERVVEKIKENFPNEYFTLESIVISNIDFNPAFKAAIEQKKVNEELAKAKEKEVQIKQAEANMKVAEAEGDKQVKIKQAEAEAEQKKLKAAANAYEIEEIGKAEAMALRLKKEELTPEMIQNNWIDAIRTTWDGSVPQYMMGSDGNAMNLFNFKQPMEAGE